MPQGPYQVFSDRPLGIDLLSTSMTVTVASGDTVYYADTPTVTSASNQGSIANGASQTFTTGVWLRSASLSAVTVAQVGVSQDVVLGTDGAIGGPGGTALTGPVVSDSSGFGGSQVVAPVLASSALRPIPAPGSWVPVSASAISIGSGWKSGAVRDGDIVWDPATGQYAFLYAAYDGSTYETIGIAYSSDLIHWTDYGSNPVFPQNPTGGQPDSGGVSFPQLYWDGTTWHMWYIGLASTGLEQGTPTIMRATATALTGPWTRQGTVLAASTVDGTFTVIYRPNVRKIGSKLYMFFNVGTAAGHEHIYYATATSPAGPWTVGGKAIDKAAITGSDFVSDPCLVPYGTGYVMYFWAGGSAGSVFQATCSASEFPATWHVNQQTIVPQSWGNGARQTFITGPQGPLLFIQKQATGPITIWSQSQVIAPNYSRQQAMPGMYFPSTPWATLNNGGQALTQTTTYLALGVPTEDMLVDRLVFYVFGADASNPNGDLGIYSGDLTTLLTSLGSTAAMFNGASTLVSKTVTPVLLRAGQPYYAALAIAATASPPTVGFVNFVTANMAKMMGGAVPVMETASKAVGPPLAAPLTGTAASFGVPLFAARTN